MTEQLSRRTLLRTLAVGTIPATVGTAAGETAGQVAASGRWTQHGASGANTNWTEDRGPQFNQHTDWVVELPSADSAPLVADDTVFVLDLSGGVGRIHGRRAATGSERFTVTLDESVVSGVLAADSQRVYTAAVVSPRVSAISIPDGTRVWDTALGTASERSQPDLGVTSGFRTPPRLQDGHLYLKSRTGGPQGGGVVALDAATGEFAGVYTGTFSDFAVSEDVLVGARGDPSLSEHGLVAFETATGQQRWEYSTPGRPGRPTIGDGRVFVGTSENQVHAVDTDGETAWTAPTDGWSVSLSLGAETLVAQTEDSLLALDADTGQRRWQAPAGEARPVIANGVVYVGRDRGFDAYELGSGDAVATYRNRRLSGPFSYLAVADGSLFATAPQGTVLAVEERIWRRRLLDR